MFKQQSQLHLSYFDAAVVKGVLAGLGWSLGSTPSKMQALCLSLGRSSPKNLGLGLTR